MGHHRDKVSEFVKHVNEENPEAAYEVLSGMCDPHVLITLPWGEFKTLDDFWAVELAYISMSDPHLEITREIETDDHYVFEAVYTARQTGPFELPDGSILSPTGRHINWPLCEVMEFKDEKLVAWNAYWDQLELLNQLGVDLIPAPAD